MDARASSVAAATAADAVVAVVGGDYETSGEGIDRASLGLPGVQLPWLQAVYAAAVAAKKPFALVVVQYELALRLPLLTFFCCLAHERTENPAANRAGGVPARAGASRSVSPGSGSSSPPSWRPGALSAPAPQVSPIFKSLALLMWYYKVQPLFTMMQMKPATNALSPTAQ